MKIGSWTRISTRISTRMLLATPLLLLGFVTGCGDFWQAPSGGSSGSGTAGYSLSNSGNISVAPGTTGTSLITVTPSNAFAGTVTLTCVVTPPTGAASPATCGLSPTSVVISSTTAPTSTLTTSTTSSTTPGAYNIAVTGASGSASQTTTLCAQVGTSTATCSAAAATSGVFYVLNQTAVQVVALSIASGQVNTISALTVPTPNPLAIAVAPNGQFLYVSTFDGIYLYTIASNGALTLGNGGASISQDVAYAMQVDATNSWLVDAVPGANQAQLFAIAVSPTTGQLATSPEVEQPFAGGLPASTVKQLAISPNDSNSCANCYVFVAMGSGGTELVHFNPGNANPFGAFGNLKPVNSAGGDNAVAVDPTNRLLYVGESDALASATQSGGLRAFTIGSNGVTEITGSPYPSGGTGPSAILPSADGNYVYVANQSVSGSPSGNIASFSVSTTALTSIATIGAGPTGQVGLAEDSTHSYLIAVDFAGNPDLSVYTMSSGTLTSAITSIWSTGTGGSIAIAATQ